MLEKTVIRLKIQKIIEIFFEGFAAFLTGLLIFLASGLLLDKALIFSSVTRQVYWVFSVLALAVILGRYLFYPFLNFSTLEILSQAEKLFPRLSFHFKSSWELARVSGPKFHSQALEKEHQLETEKLLRESPKIYLPLGNLMRVIIQGGLSLAFFLSLISYAHQGLMRILWPWTRENLGQEVSVFPGDARVDWGASLEVKASWKSSSLISIDYRSLNLQVETPHGFENIPWDSQTPKGASLQFSQIHSPLKYRLVFHEAVTRAYSVTPVVRPKMMSVESRTKNVDSDWNPWVENSTMDVLSGHVFEVRGQPNENLKSASFLISKPPRAFLMSQTRNGAYQALFTVSRDFGFGFSLVSETGEKNHGGLKYWVHVLPDQPPTVQILSPRYPVEGSRFDSLPISYLAQDDGGIVKIFLSLASSDGPERELTIKTPDNAKEIYGDYSLNLSQLLVGNNRVKIAAVDNASSPHTSYSSPIQIKVIDLKRIRRKVKKAWKKAEKALAQLSDSENKALSALKQNPLGAQKQADLSQANAQKALRDMDELRRALSQDPYLNSALKSSLSVLKKRLDQEWSHGFEKARKNLALGNQEKASAQHQKILNSAQQAGQFLSQAEKLGELEDAAMNTAQMENQASELSSRLKEMSKEGKVSEAQKMEMQKEISSLAKEIEKLARKMAQIPHSKGSPASSSTPFPLEEAQQSLNDLAQALSSGNYEKAAQMAKRLEDEMEQMKSAMSEMARNSVFSSKMEKAARQLAKARETLSEAIQKERGVRQETSFLEKERLQREIAKQKDLLKKLAKMQGVLVSSASAQGGPFPPFILNQMKLIQAQFKSESAGNADEELLQVSSSLRASKVFNPHFPWDYFAQGEDRIRKILEKGVSGVLADLKKSGAEAQNQGQAKMLTQSALKQLQRLEMTVEIPESTMKNLSTASGDEESAQENLEKGQSQNALIDEENALSKLAQGLGSLDQSLSAEKSLESSLMEGFGGFSTLRILGQGNPGEGLGAQMELTPLPNSRDYQPLKKMRREIEKSMKQKSPLEYQNLFKDYLRRISE